MEQRLMCTREGQNQKTQEGGKNEAEAEKKMKETEIPVSDVHQHRYSV